MDYHKLTKREKGNKSETKKVDKDGWKWMDLNDKDAVQFYAECMRLEKKEYEESLFHKKSLQNNKNHKKHKKS